MTLDYSIKPGHSPYWRAVAVLNLQRKAAEPEQIFSTAVKVAQVLYIDNILCRKQLFIFSFIVCVRSIPFICIYADCSTAHRILYIIGQVEFFFPAKGDQRFRAAFLSAQLCLLFICQFFEPFFFHNSTSLFFN